MSDIQLTTPAIKQQCLQTHTTALLAYDLGTLTAAQQSAGSGRINGKNIVELNTTITPRLPTSKILITVSLAYHAYYPAYGAWYLVRNIGGTRTEIGSPEGPYGSRPYGFATFGYNSDQPVSGGTPTKSVSTNINLKRSFVDTPNTLLPVTYELWAYSTTQNQNYVYINRTTDDADQTDDPRSTSQMILQEYFA
jgi:hypothetical protein